MKIGSKEVNVPGWGSIGGIIVLAIAVWLVYFVIETTRALDIWPAG